MSPEETTQEQRGQQWLEELLRLAGLPSTVAVEQLVEDLPAFDHSEDGSSETSESVVSCWLTISETGLTADQIQILTGPNGSVLDAMQYLANTILNLGQQRDQQRAYTIELNGYRARRQAELRAMAEHAAEQVRQTGEEFEMKSLSSAERRQVHTLLQACSDLETYSRGREPDRRLIVRRAQT